MSCNDNFARVWDIVEQIGVCVLTTKFDGGLRARPVEARADRDAGIIRVVTDLRSAKEHEIDAEHDVALAFVDADDSIYLSISALASISRDRAKIEAAWRSRDSVWWHGGPDDPNVCVLEIAPRIAELWDGPSSRIVAAFEFAKAKLTGSEPKLGENRKTTVRM
jgi:general stress protein 26